MRSDKPFRVMWLLNHTSARKFELKILKQIGIREIFLPKLYPQEIDFRSASTSFEEDRSLTIPPSDLSVLNSEDWYGSPSKDAWCIANRHFDALFFILYKPEILRSIAENFSGAVLWRAYGSIEGGSHGRRVLQFAPNCGVQSIRSIGRRFWFAQAYERLHEIEPEYIATRRVFLPLGMENTAVSDHWNGEEKKIYFVCADIETNAYYRKILEWFVGSFGDFPYAIGGAQAIASDHPGVLGFLPLAEHERNMNRFRLMFYHSREPHHVHFHPFEAIRAGMPLVFMGGGMLDRLGGIGLPGRCETVQEARAKIRRILGDDWKFIEGIRSSQLRLLEAMKIENCVKAWQSGIRLVQKELAISRSEQSLRAAKPRRLAIILPVEYRGGSLRGAKLLAQAILQGSRDYGEPIEVIFLHLDNKQAYPEEVFSDLAPGIMRRPYRWKILEAGEARRAMRYAGNLNWEPRGARYLVPDDGIRQLSDCDLWLVISDRLSAPLLPMRPVVHMVYDYLQRYLPLLPHGADQPFLDAVRNADRVLVTTRFTEQDALHYAGVSPNRVVKVPMLAPDFSSSSKCDDTPCRNYFIWTTNANPHKNHDNALKALWIYFEELRGNMSCVVTGVNTKELFANPPQHLVETIGKIKSNNAIRRRLIAKGELSEREYKQVLSGAAFLWHPGTIDNGTFSVVEAASVGVPALSSDYPAMREIDEQFSLNLMWIDAENPLVMAEALAEMESSYIARQKLLPSKSVLSRQNVDQLAGEYWRVIRECL